jgi:hypothetical protein
MADPLLASIPVSPKDSQEAYGIHQSDLIIRTAVIAALADLRANPWLLDYVFASLPKDELTRAVYGEQDVARAKEWILNTEVAVFINVNPNEVKFPCVSIALQSSNEDETTIGDTHYVPNESNDSTWPVIAEPVDVIEYVPGSGTVVFDETQLGGARLAKGMILLDRAGNQYPILEVVEDNEVKIKPQVIANLSGLSIRSQRPAVNVEMESAVYKETYLLGVHTDSDPIHLTYLHSVIVFALLRYKENLLEARGFEKSSISSSDFRRDDETLPEFVYSRYVSVSGIVRQSWPKLVTGRIVAVDTNTSASATDDMAVSSFIFTDGEDEA